MPDTPYTAWLTGPQSTQFYTRTYLPPSSAPNAVVVFVHGFAEHIGRYAHFHPLLAEQGIAVFAFDQRGFGLTAQDAEGNKSKTSAYGKTCWKDQMEDIEWALNHAKETFKDIPLFLMGHSMACFPLSGGAEVLGFASSGDQCPHKSALPSLAGVIATSPLISQANPASKLLKWIGGKASLLAPYTLIPAEVKAEDLSHDEAFNSAYLKDPLIKQSGSLKGIHDMLSKGEELLRTLHKHWPPSLPVLIVHGTADKVTSYKASQTFHDAIQAVEKKITLFEGGYHELQNEPDGVKEKLVNEVVNFVHEHCSSAAISAKGAGAQVLSTPETIAEPAAPTEAGLIPSGVMSHRSNL